MPLALQYFHTRMAGVSDKDAGYDAKLQLRLPAGCHGPLRLGLGARAWPCSRPGRSRRWAPSRSAGPAATCRTTSSSSGSRTSTSRPTSTTPSSRTRPVHPAHPVAAPRKRLRRARRAAAAAGLVDQHHVLPARLGSAAGRASDDGHVRGARGDEPGRRAPSWPRSGRFMGEMAGDGLPGGLRRRHQDRPSTRVSDDYRGLRGSTLDLYRQPGEAAGADGDADAHGHRPGHRRRQGQRATRASSSRCTAAPPASSTTSSSPGTTGPASRRSSSRSSRQASRRCPFFEGDYTPRLKYLAELPPGEVAAHFDRTDRKKFKEIVRSQPLLLGRRAGVAAWSPARPRR